MKIAIDCPYDTDMLDLDLLILGGLLQRLEACGIGGRVEVNTNGDVPVLVIEDDGQTEALRTAIGFMQEIFDAVEARTPAPKRPRGADRRL